MGNRSFWSHAGAGSGQQNQPAELLSQLNQLETRRAALFSNIQEYNQAIMQATANSIDAKKELNAIVLPLKAQQAKIREIRSQMDAMILVSNNEDVPLDDEFDTLSLDYGALKNEYTPLKAKYDTLYGSIEGYQREIKLKTSMITVWREELATLITAINECRTQLAILMPVEFASQISPPFQ